MKVVEVIYPEFQNVYADLYQMYFLQKCNKDIKVVYTSYNDEPYFVNNKVDMIYMGSMPDSKIIPSIEKLRKYSAKIKELIKSDVLFLITGNALEIFSSYIIADEDEVSTAGLLYLSPGRRVTIQVLVISFCMRINDRMKAHRVIQSCLDVAGSMRCSTVKIRYTDGDRLCTALKVRAYRCNKDTELVFIRRFYSDN